MFGAGTYEGGIVYNINDAGNYLWGAAMNVLGFSYQNAQRSAQLNELGKDSEDDQRAIFNGHTHHEMLYNVRPQPVGILGNDHFKDCAPKFAREAVKKRNN